MDVIASSKANAFLRAVNSCRATETKRFQFVLNSPRVPPPAPEHLGCPKLAGAS